MKESPVLPTALDQMISDDRTQVLKAAIPYLPRQNQSFLSVLAKTMELSNVISLFSGPKSEIEIQSALVPSSPVEVLNEISAHCTGPFRGKIHEVVRMFSMLELIQTLNTEASESEAVRDRNSDDT